MRVTILRQIQKRFTKNIETVVDHDLFILPGNEYFDDNLRKVLNRMSWHERKDLLVVFNKIYLHGANALLDEIRQLKGEVK